MAIILQIISGIIQIIFLIMKNKTQMNDETKKKKDEAYVEAKEAIKSADLSRINAAIDKLRDA